MPFCEKCQKVDVLEISVNNLNSDVLDLKQDIKEVRSELLNWFDRLDGFTQELHIGQIQNSERLKTLETISDQLAEDKKLAKSFRNKLLIVFAGGIVSIGIFVVQQFFQ